MSTGSSTYTNPVFPENFPDPFVLRFNGRYYAYATSPERVDAAGQLVFPVLSSRDLVHWEAHGRVLAAPDLPGIDAYWAPEVAYANGKFYLYYAAGNDADPNHHLRVAVAEHPLGPWVDSGKNLTPEELFAIDAHPFRDPQDGRWYLYYARDSLTPPYAGTGLAVDELITMEQLAGSPREVLRPFSAWQLFELQRAIKQHLDWYTVEGPFVIWRDGRYVCFYSGGRWENPNYGVSYALADAPQGPWSEEVGLEGPSLLRTVPDRVIGPGHNSVIMGPDLLTDYIVYHGWDLAGTARFPRIDRITWEGTRPEIRGPTSDPQPMPRAADIACWFEHGEPEDVWAARGNWTSFDGGTGALGEARLALQEVQESFVAETSARGLEDASAFGVAVGPLEAVVEADALRCGECSVSLPAGFRRDAWHRLSLRRSGGALTITLDEYPTLTVPDPGSPAEVALLTGSGAVFSHFALTRLEG
jgi:GH43 family beta-xylosidase